MQIALVGPVLTCQRDRNGDQTVADVGQLRAFRARATMVFQPFNLWSHLTARDNVMLGLIRVHGLPRAETGERANHHLARVGHGKDAYPEFPSEDEQQCVAIARALAMEPERMLFDEPTSVLDPELVGEVLPVMRSLAEEGRTMIVATHVMNFARDVASRVVFLDRDDPAQILRHPRNARL